MDERLKEKAKIVDQEKALKAMVETTAKEKSEAADASKRKAVDTKKPSWLRRRS